MSATRVALTAVVLCVLAGCPITATPKVEYSVARYTAQCARLSGHASIGDAGWLTCVIPDSVVVSQVVP